MKNILYKSVTEVLSSEKESDLRSFSTWRYPADAPLLCFLQSFVFAAHTQVLNRSCPCHTVQLGLHCVFILCFTRNMTLWIFMKLTGLGPEMPTRDVSTAHICPVLELGVVCEQVWSMTAVLQELHMTEQSYERIMNCLHANGEISTVLLTGILKAT